MFENKNSRTELSDLGEFGLISHLAANIKSKNLKTIKGIGDDCAVIDRGDHFELVTCDLLLEGVHFDLSFYPLKHLGYKAVMVNLSDIYAMNGTPERIVVGLGLSNRFSLEAGEELYEGMLLACDRHNVDLVGGDTTSSRSGLVLSVTAIGSVAKESVVYRSGAAENDLICVSGDLGAAFAGLQILNREKKVFIENPNIQPDLSGFDYAVERQLKPEARKDIVGALKSNDVVPTSMIDISDGLASELFHICVASSKGCRIYEDKIPIDVETVAIAEELNINPTVAALNGGEDYELLFTIRQSDFEKVKAITGVSVIGYVTAESAGLALIDKSEHETPLKAQGWDGLKMRQE
ncbi:MAG: thiamine-phosphate kinase [Bacteroidetes bacterium]|nr:thiamine-phosphate kinase [Bacteroidota bacterium]